MSSAFLQNELPNELDMYDVKVISLLEEHLTKQCKSASSYDFAANTHLLKMYKMYPKASNKETQTDMTARALLKGLMALPKTDYLALSYLVDAQLHDQESISTIMKLADLLETAQFQSFWTETKSSSVHKYIQSMDKFNLMINAYIYQVVSWTYQTIPMSKLQEYVQMDIKEMNTLLEVHGGKINGDVVELPKNEFNHFEEHNKEEQPIPPAVVSRLLARTI